MSTGSGSLKPWAFTTGITLATVGMVCSIVLFLAMLASMQIIQNKLPDSAAMSIARMGQEVDLLALQWKQARQEIDHGPGDTQDVGKDYAAFLRGVEILIARIATIRDGRLFSYLDRYPELQKPAAELESLVQQLDDATQDPTVPNAERRNRIDAAIGQLTHAVSLFVAHTQKARDDLIEQGLREVRLFRWLVASAIILSIGTALMLTFVVWRQNRRLTEESAALLEARKEAELARNRTELAMRSRTQLFANTSHELRTPLNAIMGFSEVMATEAFGKLGNDRYRGYCQDIHGSAQILLELVDDLLLLGAVEEGKYDIWLEPVAIGQVVDRIRSILIQKAADRHILLEFKVDPGLWVRGEPRAIRQILTNLIDNAIKYAPSGGKVTCTIRGEDSCVLFQVLDNGPGIPDTQLAQLFRPFQRGEDAFVRQTKGAGLGLAIVKALADRLETCIRLSRNTPHGLRAEFHLPCLPAPSMPVDAALSGQQDAARGNS